MNLFVIFSIFIILHLISDSSCNDEPSEDELKIVIGTRGWRSMKGTNFYKNSYEKTNHNVINLAFLEWQSYDSMYQCSGIILNSIYVCLIEQLYKKYSNAANRYMKFHDNTDKNNSLQKLWRSITMMDCFVTHLINGLKFFNIEDKAVLENLIQFKTFIKKNTIQGTYSEDSINVKFIKIINVVTFDNNLQNFKEKHVDQRRIEYSILYFINSLCGVDDQIINDNEFINPDQNDIKIKIEYSIKMFYFDFGFRYNLFNQANLEELNEELYLISNSICKSKPTEKELKLVINVSGWTSINTRLYDNYDEKLKNNSIWLAFVHTGSYDSMYKSGGVILNSIYVCLIEQLYKKYSNAANYYMKLHNNTDKNKWLQKLWKSIIMIDCLVTHLINGLKFFNFKEIAVLENLIKFKTFIKENTIKGPYNEYSIDDKFTEIINVVTFDNNLQNFKEKHVEQRRIEYFILYFINSLCGVDDKIIKDDEFIDPDQNDIKKIIEYGIQVFYFNFGFDYDFFNQHFEPEDIIDMTTGELRIWDYMCINF
ncbi:uncharacterized protein LOC126905110 [Daktulosphaira vitifoliae]|uniref:uncharacterized protein LOC126905110 n=1 Tax=Daktulosphaira vitifoliae TaxID=58002 RepID=UPI0021AADECB|nr:uncharacterized protein LOC126905110 [Daktulosphaira vitifoliae]